MELQASLSLIAPEIVLSLSALALLLIGAWGGDKTSRMNSIAACIALAFCFAIVAPRVCAGVGGPDTVAFFGQFKADAFSGFAKLLIYAGSAAALLIAPSYLERVGAMRAEYPVLVILATLGMSIMVSAGDLLTLYIGLELNSLAAYVLAAFVRSDSRSAEAGLKYFVLGALASGILLFGMSLTYGFTGTTNFNAISTVVADGLSGGQLFGLIFMLVGLAFKISAVPFHMWTPDVYEGAPTPVTAFFATAPKVAAVALLARVSLEAFGTQVDAWRQVVVFAALASIIVGALGAIGQKNIKRLLAYSSINNVGFILVGLAAGTAQGAASMLLYLAVYVAMTVGSFVAVLMLKNEDGEQLESISDLSGLRSTSPVLALCLMSLMFSLAGIPPFLGFWGKLVVFQAAVDANLVVLALLAIAASVIGAFYYIKIVKVMFFDQPSGVVLGKSDGIHWALLGISTLVISPLGYLATSWFGDLAQRAAATLFLLS